MTKRFLLYTLFFLTVMTVQARVYLVAVGIDDNSRMGLPTLRSCVNDVKIMEWLYKKNGQKQKSQQAVTRVLLDNKATAENVVTAMNDLFVKANNNDYVVFYFSGHGGNGNIACYDSAISYDAVRKAMAKSNSKHKIIFIDACMSGSLRQQPSSNRESLSTTDVLLFLSSRDSETSGAGDGHFTKNSTFTRYLSSGLRGRADHNKDRRITARELYMFVRDGVKKETSGRQNPVMWGNFEHDMTVISWPKKK